MIRKQKNNNSAKKKEKLFEAEVKKVLKVFDRKDYFNAYQKLNELISMNPERADLVHLAGVCLLSLNDIKNAQSYFKRAWTLNNENLDYAHSLANAACMNGRYEEAIKLYNFIVGKNPKIAHVWNQLGHIYQLQGNGELAAKHFQKSLELDSAHTNYSFIGAMLFKLKYYDQAQYYFEKAEELDPENPRYKQSLASVFFLQGNPEKSFKYVMEVLALDGENVRAMIQLGQILRENNVGIMQYSKKDQDVIRNILSKNCVEHMIFTRAWSDLIRLNPDNQCLGDLLSCETYEELAEKIDWDSLLPVLSDDFFGAGLRFIVVKALSLENFLIRIRRYFVELYKKGGFDQFDTDKKKQVFKFLCVLGEQCFLNEYVYPETDREKETISGLLETLSDHHKYHDVLGELALISTFCSLYKLPFASRMQEDFKNNKGIPHHFRCLLELQLFEPLLEEEIKNGITVLGSINNKVSEDVREQYEENPYPRWRSVDVVKNFNPIQARAEIDILIAGCGSGRQTVLTCNNFPAAKITAIDLSRASIAYSIRKTREYGVDKRVTHLHADILELGLLEKQYDLIMCSGVLHHMEKPEDGLKVLKGLLKPGGAMNIGLYSDIAREKIVKAREEAQRRNIPPTKKGISSYREDIKALSECQELKQMLQLNDFYTTSACRDLLFHVQEHRFTFLTLKDFLGGCDLEFLDLSSSRGALSKKFRKMYSDPDDFYNLEKWHEFEKCNQEEFLGMYQIWVCHKKDWDQLKINAPLVN